MEDHKRLIFPAIAAIIIHGFLISFKLPKHDISKPVLTGNPIRVEINAFSPETIAPKKNEADKRVEVIPRVTAQKEVVQEKKGLVQPISVRKRPKKIPIKSVLTKRETIIEDKHKAIDLQQQQLESQSKDQAVALETTASTHTGNKNNEIEADRPKGSNSIVPIRQTAIPAYRQNEEPSYPAMAKMRGYEGEILLNVLVNPKGKVSEIKIKHSSGHVSLDTAALETVKNWLFTPATEGGRPISMWVDVPIEFKLKSNSNS